MGRLVYSVDKRVDRLIIIKREPNDKWGASRWLCKCDCGNEVVVSSSDLHRGHTRSCGCYRKETAKKNRCDAEKGENNPAKRLEVRIKISESLMGENNPMFGRTGENSPWFNRKHTEETRKIMSENHADFSGENNPFYNRNHTEETRRIISENHIDFNGGNNPNWQGGISFEPYSPEFNEKLKNKIRERDNYTCQLCGEYGRDVHHIDYNKKNCSPDNLITLCNRDNAKVNFNRSQWEIYFRLYLMLMKSEVNNHG